MKLDLLRTQKKPGSQTGSRNKKRHFRAWLSPRFGHYPSSSVQLNPRAKGLYYLHCHLHIGAETQKVDDSHAFPKADQTPTFDKDDENWRLDELANTRHRGKKGRKKTQTKTSKRHAKPACDQVISSSDLFLTQTHAHNVRLLLEVPAQDGVRLCVNYSPLGRSMGMMRRNTCEMMMIFSLKGGVRDGGSDSVKPRYDSARFFWSVRVRVHIPSRNTGASLDYFDSLSC